MELLPGFEPGTSSLPSVGNSVDYVENTREKCKADFDLPPFYPRISRIQVISVVVPVTVRP